MSHMPLISLFLYSLIPPGKDTDVGFSLPFKDIPTISIASLKCTYCSKKPLLVMNRVDFRVMANARLAARLRQVLVLFLAVVVGILVSVSYNF
jgi:hypothetical protein